MLRSSLRSAAPGVLTRIPLRHRLGERGEDNPPEGFRSLARPLWSLEGDAGELYPSPEL
jgi:hypothetical protein